jgi:hypothetical protein
MMGGLANARFGAHTGRARRPGRRLAGLIAVGLSLLGGCDDGAETRRILELKARQARLQPPALWSVEALDAGGGARPVLICANARIVSGFFSVVPAAGGETCALETQMTPTPTGVHYRCRLGGVRYAVSSGVAGDQRRDFVVSSSIYPLSDGGFERVRILRFRRLGPCPTGWRPGEATDRTGARRLAFQDQP